MLCAERTAALEQTLVGARSTEVRPNGAPGLNVCSKRGWKKPSVGAYLGSDC